MPRQYKQIHFVLGKMYLYISIMHLTMTEIMSECDFRNDVLSFDVGIVYWCNCVLLN